MSRTFLLPERVLHLDKQNFTIVTTVGLAVICFAYFRLAKSSFPPGPRPYPIIGNLFDLKSFKYPWDTLTLWKEKYGNTVGLRAFGTNVIVLNSTEEFEELLVKRSRKYSHRPLLTVVREMLSLEKGLPLCDYNQDWREMRKLAHIALGPTPVKQYHRMQQDMASMMAKEILDDSQNYRNILRSYASRFILAITYGLPYTHDIQEHVEIAERAMVVARESVLVGAYLCDIIPALKHLPSFVPFQKRIAQARQLVDEMVTKPFEQVKKDTAEGKARPSLTNDILSQFQDNLTQEIHDRVMWTSASMFTAGSESSFATALMFILAMVLNPEKQKIAQAEIDAVIGPEKLPEIEDRSRLPYVDALVKETMRWRPILPLGLPRRTAEADEYKGMHIPAGTVVLTNVWAVAFEPNPIYPPKEFHPERFLDDRYPTTDPATWAFGFGRRICPGKTLGENNVFILLSTLLAVFDISMPDDGFTMPNFMSDIGSTPEPFECLIRPRNAGMENAVRQKALRAVEDGW